MNPDNYLPAPHVSPAELAVVELSKSVDHILSLAPRLSQEDLDAVRTEHRRLLDLLLERSERRKVA